jgi:phenylacetate-CoA ligase
LFFREDGAVVSASEIDAAIPAEFRCWHHRLVQTGDSRWDFHYVADETAPESLARQIAEVLGGQTRVNAFRRRSITPAASGKFSLLKPL